MTALLQKVKVSEGDSVVERTESFTAASTFFRELREECLHFGPPPKLNVVPMVSRTVSFNERSTYLQHRSFDLNTFCTRNALMYNRKSETILKWTERGNQIDILPTWECFGRHIN